MANKPTSDRESLAWYFAKEKHKGQMRKFVNKSYFDAHVQKVNGTTKMYSNDEDELIIALLHDVPEDCYKNKWEAYSIIKALFGVEVADPVLELTNDKDEIKHKYNGDKAAYLIDKMLKMSEKAFTVKLADRLNNIGDAFTADESFRNKYYIETTRIAKGIEGKREFNKKQKQIFADIKAKTENVKSIFKL
jgi:(p)ppGpp synthase/HD superfamily hydrolase